MPDEGSTDWHLPLNANFEQLDTDVEIRDTEGQLDTYEPKDGAKFFAVDTGAVFVGDGESWARSSLSTLSVSDSFQLPALDADPADPADGELWFRTDLTELRINTDDGVQTLSWSTGSDDATDEDDGETDQYDVVEPLDDASWVDTFGDEWDYGIETNASIRDISGRSGDQLQMRVPSGENRGVYTVHNHKSRTGTAPTKCYHRFYIRFEPGFHDNRTEDGKLPGFAGRSGTSEGAGGTPASGTGWSARMGWDKLWRHSGSEIPLEWYLYHMDASGSYGEHDFIRYLDEGQWYLIEQYIDLGEPNTNDSTLRCWVDGELEYERTDLRWRESGGNDIEWSWWDLYHGGGGTPDDDIYVQFDDFKLTRGGMP